MRRVLDHGQFIMGPEIAELEQALASYVGVKHCITVASGTDSLEIALRALGIGPGDEVITIPFTWISTAEVIGLVGAKPVFVDIEARHVQHQRGSYRGGHHSSDQGAPAGESVRSDAGLRPDQCHRRPARLAGHRRRSAELWCDTAGPPELSASRPSGAPASSRETAWLLRRRRGLVTNDDDLAEKMRAIRATAD